jgi:hypothetical protein
LFTFSRLKARLGARIVDQVCPYCFETYRLAATPFRCINPKCKKAQDPVRARVWQDADPRGLVLASAGSYREAARCSDCSQDSRTRICPHCHMELPHTVGQFPNLIIALIGAKDAGKSHYIAVLIEHFRKRLGPDLGLLLEALDDATINRYRRDFHDPVFKQRRTIHNTGSGMGDASAVRVPLVYSLTSSGTGLLGGRGVNSVVTLVFFDTAGEDLNTEDRMSLVNKYIYRADGIILLLDPLQLEVVRARLPSSVALPDQSTETTDILQRVGKLIRGGRSLSATARIPTPIAVAFTKFDAVEPIVESQMQLFQDADHRRGYDMRDFQAVTAEMRALLAEWDSLPIQQHVETHYEKSAFFGLTALGCNPHATGSIPRVAPRRIEDPFLWLLHHHGVLPAAKGNR